MLRFPAFPPLLLGLLTATAAAAQTLPLLDQNPPGLRWQRVRTPHFRVLYPAGFDSAAQHTARQLEQAHAAGTRSLGVSARPLTVVLQTQTTVSNGFVTFLPRHAEFFTMPPQEAGLGTVDWLDQLVVHEFRHVGQFDKARQGLGRVLVPLLGEGALGVMSVGMPPWFFEGDAVGTETALTRSGRGRIPGFDVGLRANLLSRRRYSYQEAVCGSFRHQVPDWYTLGYFLTSYVKVHYDAAAWDRVLDHYYRFPFYPFSFSAGIRHVTGLRVEQVYQRAMQEADSVWRAPQAGLALTEATDFSGQAPEKIYTNYQYPQYLTDSTVLVLKSGLGDIAQWVRLGRHGREERVFVPGLIHLSEALSVAAGKAVWPEYQPDPRWGQRTYSELRVLDLTTGQLTRLTRRSRYTSAALSPDGGRIVATETDDQYRHRLLILDARSGVVLQELPNPQNRLYLQPRFLPDGQRVAAVVLDKAGKALELLDPAAGTARALLPAANVNLSNPQPWRDYVLYNSPQSGRDNIHAVDVRSGQTYQLTSRPLGAYHAAVAPDGRHLAFHEARAQGSRVVEMLLDPAAWTPVTPPAADPERLYSGLLTATDPGAPQLRPQLTVPDSTGRFPVQRYRPLAHAFNVFSYGLVQSSSGTGLSLGVRSQDYLNTTQAIAGLNYDQTERTTAFFGGLSYQGRFPVFDLDIEHGGRNAGLLVNGVTYRDRWRYTRLTTGLRLPLTLTRSKYLQALSVGAYYLHEEVRGYDLPARYRTDVGPDNPLNALQGTISYARQLKQSTRDVAPRWGQSVLLTGRTTPFGQGLNARQLGLIGSVYVPGFGRHHSLRLRGGYQWQRQQEYLFAPAVFFPRGSGYVGFDRLAVGSAEYRLPLADTHWVLGRWLYVQRLKASAFADVARGRNQPSMGAAVTRDYRNVGGTVSVVFNVLRLRTPLETGVRAIYNTYTRQWTVDPLVLDIGI